MKKKAIYAMMIAFSVAVIISMQFNRASLSITAQGLDIRHYINIDNEDFNGYTGENINVAIIDSGISPHHDISPSRILIFKDFTSSKNESYDDNGHGTFIAGIIGANGKYKGIAPDVNYIVLKVLDTYGLTDGSTLLSALNWLYLNSETYSIRLVNISLGVKANLDFEVDPVCKMIKKLHDQGITVVCSVGNNSEPFDSDNLLSPGISPDVITVGSCKSNMTYTLTDDVVTNFSAKGKKYSFYNKPDIVSLGVDILSLDYQNNDDYVVRSGTSFSCAIVTGFIALLYQKYQDASNTTIKDILLRNTIQITSNSLIDQGNGELHAS